ncbi:hypothetical protein VTK73DRAFT_7370 [Phialemonium thermophilum]|uniref:Tyrosine specific protein phosphatases domain-containing protein n=1 Tax=Phialemonium thermophilum TaxID=223376 RepID=A0ABR3WEV9_9PEZI
MSTPNSLTTTVVHDHAPTLATIDPPSAEVRRKGSYVRPIGCYLTQKDSNPWMTHRLSIHLPSRLLRRSPSRPFSAHCIEQGQTPMNPRRLVALKGTLNMRDIGGYPTVDGKHVVCGRIYRSANLAQLGPDDIAQLQEMGIHTVVDLRGSKEARDDPDRLPPGTDYANTPIIGNSKGDGIDEGTISRLIAAAGLPKSMLNTAKVTAEGPYYRMLYLASSYGTDAHTAKLAGYRPLFQKLLTLPPTSNLLFHCTGGRDRTGVATALLHKTLGVPDDMIESDFVASNEYLQPDRDNPDSTRFREFRSTNVFLQPSTNKEFQRVAADFGASPDEIRGAVELRPDLLRRMFRAIQDKYGSFDAFLASELGVGRTEREALKERFTS